MNTKKVKSLCERIYDLAEELMYATFDSEVRGNAERVMTHAEDVLAYVEECPDEIE